MQKGIDAGKSLDELKTAGLPDKWKSWAVPTVSAARWIEILYNGLTKK